MRRNLGRLTPKARAAIICAVIVAVIGAAAGGWKISHRPAALPHPTCGSATTHFLTGHTRLLTADRGALTCFIRATRECRSASLGLTEMGVDTGTNFVFTVEPGRARCQVSEFRQDYSANFGGSQSAVTSMRCQRVAVTPDGVALRCGGRQVLIPPAVSAPSPDAS
jgi:hypothetical protein